MRTFLWVACHFLVSSRGSRAAGERGAGELLELPFMTALIP